MNNRTIWRLGLLGVLMLSGAAFYAWHCREDVEPTILIFRENVEDAGRSRALTNEVVQTGMPERAARRLSYDESNARTTNGLVRLPFGKERPYDIRYAENKGALGRVTFHVVDTEGNPVPGATVRGGFYNNGKEGHGFSEQTDAEGLLTVQDTCTGDLNFDVRKTGYYQTRHRYWFFKTGFDCVENGRWIPWNPVLKVVLKEVRNPVEMEIKYMDINLPKIGAAFGCDLVVGDLVYPYGRGKTSDMVFQYDSVPKTNSTDSVWTHRLAILFTNGTDGVILTKLDTYSQMQFPYVAPLDGYAQEVSSILAGVGDKTLTDKRITEADGLIFRIRANFNERKRCSDALYGKILGPVFVNGLQKEVRFEYYLIKDENERSLEVAGSHP